MTQPAPNPPPPQTPAPPAPAEPQGPTLAMVTQSGQVVQVPHADVQAAYKSGKFGFVKGQTVQVEGADGTVGNVDAEHAGAVLSAGGRLVSPEEYRKAELDNRYGGIGDALVATAEGGARGLTLGISDSLAIQAGKLIGGDKGEQAVREHLLSEKEEHPYGSVVGEGIGIIAPLIASGGTAAAGEALVKAGAEAAEPLARLGAEGLGGTLLRGAWDTSAQAAARGAVGAADEAQVIASIGKGVRTLGALPRSVSYLGDAAEHAVSGLLGASESALAGTAKKAASLAIRNVVEGGLFGAGQEISESALHDQPLTMEKLVSSVGHAALMNGLLGTGLGVAGHLAAEAAGGVLGKLAPTLDEAAGEQAWKWLDPLKKYSEQASKRAGGTDAVGRTVFEEVLRPLVEEQGLGAAALSHEEKLALVGKALDRKGAEIGDLIRGNDKATVDIKDMLRPIEDRIDEFAGRVGGEDKVAKLEQLKRSVQRVLGVEEPVAIQQRLKGLVNGSPEWDAALAAAGYTKRSPAELGEYMRANPELLSKPGPAPLEATHVAPVGPASTGKVAIADAIAQRRSLQQIAFEETKSLDPNLRVQLLRDVAGDWNKLEERALNEASASEGGLAGTQLRALNKTYQQLKIASDALETNTARYATNRNLSLSDYLSGAAHAPSLLLSGHPVAAATAVGLSVAHKALRAHGNAYAALMLDRLATFGGMSRAVREIDEETDRAIDRALSGKLLKGGKVDHSDARFEDEEQRVRQLASMSPALVNAHLQDQVRSISTHLPQTAGQMASTAKAVTAWVASKLPPNPATDGPSMTPQLEKRTPTQQDKSRLLNAVDAANDGTHGIMQRFAKGNITPEDIEYLRKFAPNSYAELRTKVAAKCADRKNTPSYQAKLRFSQLFNEPMDPTMTPQFRMGIADSYAKHPHAEPGMGPAAPKRAPKELSLSKSLASPFEAARGRS